MSLLTIQLQDRKPPHHSSIRKWSVRLAEIADRLVEAYGVPALGNFDDPVTEIFYIALSARTTDSQYRKTHRALYERFPTLAELASADVRDIVPCIVGGGLANKRAGQIKRTATALLERLGPDPSTAIRKMPVADAYAFLVNLPGMGPKSAFCVMMCSLGSDVFPVDVNVQRIATRVGALKRGLKHYQAQQRLPGLIPEGRSHEMHVGLVVLGRNVCLPRKPHCEACPIRGLCDTGRRLKFEQEAAGNGSDDAIKTSSD